MEVEIKKCSVADAKSNSNFPYLFREYADECAFHDLPAPDEKLAAYDALDASGIFTLYGAFLDGSYQGIGPLIGFAAVLTPVIPHYGIGITCMESLFVAKEFRNCSGVGLKLLWAAERHARDAGSPGLIISAPAGGKLSSVLEKLSTYRETNRVFFRKTT